MRATLIIALLSLVSATADAQVAWTRDAGRGYLGLELAHQANDQFYGVDFERRTIAGVYAQTSLSLYGEFGLVDRWLTATVEGELFRRNALTDQGATLGFGDLRLGLWTGLVAAPVRVSVGLRVGVPTGDADPDAGLDEEAELIANVLPTGDGELDLEPAVTFGTSFGGAGQAWPLEHYVVLGLGYWARTRGISHAITYRAEIGTRIPVVVLDRLWWTARLTGLESFASADDIANVAGNLGGLGQGVTHTSLGFELSADLVAGLAASFGFDTALRARRIIAAVPFRVGLSWSF